MASSAACIFCKIIKGDIPSFKLFESDKVFAFLDINPLSKGHAVRTMLSIPFIENTTTGEERKTNADMIPGSQLVIPKHHGAKLTDIPDDSLAELLPVVKKLVIATGAEDYNVLQNNGRIAHQEVDHPNEKEGLGIAWPQQKTDMDGLKALLADIKSKM
ncbi:Hit family protein [Lachnellula occidentalis]|uniref:Hit family protein n=1 Tax=Lachnellula occidentalis TaxID=215460 RepID=A0A8H8UJB2_9HELO|nr:Hit family protein [Lachnellula occidentalis]